MPMDLSNIKGMLEKLLAEKQKVQGEKEGLIQKSGIDEEEAEETPEFEANEHKGLPGEEEVENGEVKMPLQEFENEHKRLVKILTSKIPALLDKEKTTQSDELKGVEAHAKDTEDESGEDDTEEETTVLSGKPDSVKPMRKALIIAMKKKFSKGE